ncbi:MAG: EpsG family protein [Halioglobus sp.]
MWPYWIIFFLAALGVLSSSGSVGGGRQSHQLQLGWIFVSVIFILMVGFRHEVGGDWGSYSRHFTQIGYLPMGESLTYGDPGYYFLNWLVSRMGGNVYGVNLFCASLVVWGAGKFSRQQPLPWLALLVAVPYLIIVVAMGYSRQSAALGLALVGLSHLGRHETLKFVIFVLLGALFHKSAILLLPIAALSATHSRIWTFIWVGVVAVSGAYLLVLDSIDALWQNYVEAEMQSQGGLIRVAMNAVPAVILIAFRNRLFYTPTEKKLWLWMAIFSLATVPLITVSSTAVDRMALYFIPIQLFVFSRIPFLLNRPSDRQLMVAGVVAYYGLVQFVWLNYAHHALYWLPYRNYLFLY